MSDWQVQVLRLTVFPTQVAPLDHFLEWWHELAEDEPENVNIEPKIERVVAESDYLNGKLRFGGNPDRIDWVYLAVDDEEVGDIYLGALPSALEVFFDLIGKWFEVETTPSARRIAFGAILEVPADSQIEGYRYLQGYLKHLTLFPEDMKDFHYQINRPRPISIGSLETNINRLSKWSVSLHQKGRLEIHPLREPLLSSLESRFSSRLELDINTPSELIEEMDRNMQLQVLQELVRLGKEIADEGDFI